MIRALVVTDSIKSGTIKIPEEMFTVNPRTLAVYKKTRIEYSFSKYPDLKKIGKKQKRFGDDRVKVFSCYFNNWFSKYTFGKTQFNTIK